jgi:hypothetical protein
VGFLNPLNLLWALALAVLGLIYLRSRSRPTMEVSSLMLFDEIPAPVARVRHLRIDPLFWLEVAGLTGLVLAIAGLYAMVPARAGHGRSHALVFDLGAAMSAKTGSTSSLDEAKKQALAIVDDAPAGDEFYVITYALEAQVAIQQTQNLDAVRKAIDGLHAFAVPAHVSALAAAMMRARGASDIELFTSRPPSARAIGDAGTAALIHVHPIPHDDGNVAIVSVEPGAVGAPRGRAVVRNFSAKPRLAELSIKAGTQVILDQPLMFAPREQMVVPFRTPAEGGLITTRILTPDAIAADNQRWVLAPSSRPGRALVLSPDAAVRDDLARVLLAVNPGLQVETADPAGYHPNPNSGHPLQLAVMHDCYVPGLSAASILLIDPPAAAPPEARIPGVSVSSATVPVILGGGESNDASPGIVLPGARILTLPDWMETVASGVKAGTNELVPLAAIGRIPTGRIGILAYDVRGRLLLDPDKLDALVVAVSMVKRLTAPGDVQIVSTGSYAEVPVTGGSVLVTAPDGSTSRSVPDKWGRVRLRPMESGPYTIAAGGKTVDVFANYYDASESDLAAVKTAPATPSHETWAERVRGAGPRQVQPLLLLLAGLALAAFAVESILLMRRAARWGLGHV